MEDVFFKNIEIVDGLSSPLFIRLGARMRSPEGTPVGKIRRIKIDGLTVKSAQSWTSCIITGIPGHCVEDVEISNLSINYKGGFKRKDSRIIPPEFEKDYPEPWMFGTVPAKGFFLRHTRNIRFNNVSFTFDRKDRRPLIAKIDSQ